MARHAQKWGGQKKGLSRVNRCPKCGIHFCHHKTKVIYKEVVECIKCGHIWILWTHMEVEKWL